MLTELSLLWWAVFEFEILLKFDYVAYFDIAYYILPIPFAIKSRAFSYF